MGFEMALHASFAYKTRFYPSWKNKSQYQRRIERMANENYREKEKIHFDVAANVT